MEVVRNMLLKYIFMLEFKHAKDFGEFIGVGKSNYSQVEANKKQVDLRTALMITRKIKTRLPNIHVEDIFELVEID